MYFSFFQVISNYCKRRQQNRPFSHIVMDLHQESMAALETALDTPWGPPAMPELRHLNRNRYVFLEKKNKEKKLHITLLVETIA